MMSWLLPGALLMVRRCPGLTMAGPRTDHERAAFLLWGGCLAGIGLTISLGPGHHPPVLHGRPGATAGRPGRHGHHGRCGSAAPRGWADRPSRRPGGHHRLGLRAAGPHPGLVPLPPSSWWWPAPSVPSPSSPSRGCAGCPMLAIGLVADPRIRRRPGRTALLHRRHGGHAAQRAPFRRSPRRRPGASAAPAAASPAVDFAASVGSGGGFPGGTSRRPDWWRIPPGGFGPGRGIPGGGFGAAGPLLAGGAAPSAAGRGCRRRRVPQLEYVRLGRSPSFSRRTPALHLGRRHGELELSRRLPTGQRRSR
jgi:hypothetical protein